MSNDPQAWIRCPKCGSDDAGLIDWRPDPELTLVCTECDAVCYGAEYCGEEFAIEVYK